MAVEESHTGVLPPETGVLQIVLIKPTHYDKNGYPIQFQRSAMPSNTLACLSGLAEDIRARKALGAGVDIRVHSIDETNERVVPAAIIRSIVASGGRALIGLVGVQSNQFPRALDIARPFLQAAIPVCIGGFHVSGCLAMFPEIPPDIREAQALGISIFAGEAEGGRFGRVLRDAWSGRLGPLYNYIDDLPPLEGEPPPYLAPSQIERITGRYSCLDLGRGCPFQCSFCTIINVQGRKSRSRSADDLEHILRENSARGIRNFFITDDNFARNRNWEALLDRVIETRRREGMDFAFTFQVDTQCHLIPRFVEKAAAAGVRQIFIGLENINPDNLIAAKKRQNKITEYRALLQQWRAYGVITMAGYILGFPCDTRESILRDIEIIKRELPLDILELFYLTPLPGSEDHKILVEKGVWMDPDLNKYDLNQRVSHHGKMSDAEWEDAYRTAWSAYYTPDHIRTIMRRAAVNPHRTLVGLSAMILHYATAQDMHDLHPLEVGVSRMIFREDRRSGMPLEDPVLFHRRMENEMARKTELYVAARDRIQAIRQETLAALDRLSYSDLAITPQNDREFASLDLYHATHGGEAALARKFRDDAIRITGHAPVSLAVPAGE